MVNTQECIAALQAACQLLEDPALLAGQREAIKRLGRFTDSDDSLFWPSCAFLEQLAAAPEPPLEQALEATAGALIRLSSWVTATAARGSSPAFSALEALHDAYSLESAVRIANGLVSAAVKQEAWPLQLRYRLMAAAAALALQALPSATGAIDAYPPPAPGESEPDYERIGFRIYALVRYGSEVLRTLAFLARQLDSDSGTPGSLGSLLQATAASDARLLAGLQLVERTCRDICHNEDYDFLMGRMIQRMATLLNSAHPGTCVHRLLHSQPGISAAILIGCSDLLQRAASGLLPLSPEQQQSSRRAELRLRDRPDWLAQLPNAAGGLFAPVLAHSWPAGTSPDSLMLYRHLSSIVSSLGRLLLPEHQEQVGQMVQAFESSWPAASRPSRVHGSRLIAATAEALAALAWHVARNSSPASEPAGAAADWRMELHVGLVRMLVDLPAKCMPAVTPPTFCFPPMIDGTGHEACMLSLLEAEGSDSIDAADAQGWTPLQLAAIEGYEPCVCTLLMAGSALPGIFPYDEEGSYEPAVDAIQGAAEWLGLLSDTPDDEGSDAEGGSAGSSGGTGSSEGTDSEPEPDVSPHAALDDALHSELCCPITNDVMQDPVIAADGTTYERQGIEEWIARQQAAGQATTSPATNLPLRNTDLVENRLAKALIGSLRAGGLLSE